LTAASNDTVPTPETGAARVGADLRAARQRLGWSLPDVAAGLRIRQTYLEALETGRTADLPGNAYALGFLRAYGGALGLDGDDLSRRYRAAASDAARKPELSFPVPAPERGIPAAAVVLVSCLLAIGAYIGWYRISGDAKSPAEAPAPLPAHLTSLAEQTPPPAPPPQAAAPAATPSPASPPPSLAPSSAAAMPAPALTLPPAQQAAMAPPVPAAIPPVPSVPVQPQIVLRAKGNVWVMVKDKSGAVVLNRTLRPGDTWPVPQKPDLTMTLGNASMAELLVDGTVAPSFAASALPRRDFPLDPALIKDGKLPGQVVPGAPVTPPPRLHPVIHRAPVPAPDAAAPDAGAVTH
jgi:cytoskeleton protein RodZ